MEMTYGLKRVAEPQYVLPTSAWKLDNSRNLYPNELRISVNRIHLEGTSFKQICTESNYSEEKIKQKIIDIIIRRGKLHNPVTDTGGLVLGTIDEIGAGFHNPSICRLGIRSSAMLRWLPSRCISRILPRSTMYSTRSTRRAM